MNYQDLVDFVENRMRMSHVYQPVMIQTLLLKGGQATEREVAEAILTNDASQIEYYEKITRDMVGRVLRRITRQHMQFRAEMSALMNETLNVSGALLVKIFGRKDDEVRRFAEKTVQVRDISVRRSLVGRWLLRAYTPLSTPCRYAWTGLPSTARAICLVTRSATTRYHTGRSVKSIAPRE